MTTKKTMQNKNAQNTTTHNDTAGYVSPSDIADIAQVSRAAVSNWRRRAEDFPASAAGTASKPLFDRAAVLTWLDRHGRLPEQEIGNEGVDAGMEMWSALNLARGELEVGAATKLILGLAVARKTGVESAKDLPEVSTEAREALNRAFGNVNEADLAEAVDFVLERLVKSQGKLGANAGFVGSRTSSLLANVVPPMVGGVLYDPACGIAGALIQAAEADGVVADRIVGHDIDDEAAWIARARATLHGLVLETVTTDVLSVDVDPSLRADVILLEPPFGARFDSKQRLTDPRFEFGVPPRASADMAWIQHALAHLADDGRAYVLTAESALGRGGEEQRIRARMIEAGCIAAVVALPGKLLPHTTIPLFLWVLRGPGEARRADHVLFIDGSEAESPEEMVGAWLSDPSAHDEILQVEVNRGDIVREGADLTPHLWVNRVDRDPTELVQTYKDGLAKIAATLDEQQRQLRAFETLGKFATSRLWTIGQLIEEGLLDVQMGHPASRYDEAPHRLRERLVTPSEIGTRTFEDIDFLDEDAEWLGDYPELTHSGDVLMTTVGDIRSMQDECGFHVPTSGIARIRVTESSVLQPDYLAAMLTADWNKRFVRGTAIRRVRVKDLEIPLIDWAEQIYFVPAMNDLNSLRANSARVDHEARKVGAALMDAVRYNVTLPGKSIVQLIAEHESAKGRD